MRMRRISRNTDNTTIAIAIGMLAVVLAIIGWGIPMTDHIERGTVTCSIAVNGSSCTTAPIIFTTPYTTTPRISAFENISVPLVKTSIAAPAVNIVGGISFQTPGNTSTLIYYDETPTTVNPLGTTYGGAEQVIKVFFNSGFLVPFPTIIGEAEGYIETTVLSVKQTISISVFECSQGIILQTIYFETQLVTNGITPFAIKGVDNVIYLSPADMTVCISTNAAVDDLNTFITVASLRIYAQQPNFQTWFGMPTTSSLTPIYGDMNHLAQTANFRTGTNSIFTFCADIIAQSQNTTATIVPTFNGLEIGGSALEIPIGFTVGTLGYQCVTATSLAAFNALTGSKTLNVAGFNGGGGSFAGTNLDIPAFGAISLSWQTTVSGGTIQIGDSYSSSILIAATPISFQLKIQFAGPVNSALVVTFIWTAEGN